VQCYGQGMLGPFRPRRAGGYSFIEILTVVSLLGLLAILGGGIGNGIIGYYRLRGGAELLVQNIRAIREYSAARGSIPTPGGSSGIYFFNQHVKTDNSGPEADTNASSYVVFGASLRNHPQVDKPTGGMKPGDPFLRFVVNLPTGVRLRTTAGGNRFVTNGDVIEFGTDGTLTAASLPEVFVSEASVGTFSITMWGNAGGGGIVPSRAYAALNFDPSFFPAP
jgi:hypothetical protein